MLPLAVAQARDYVYSDAHLHYVDFFQETAGMEALLKAMDDNRIEQVMIAGIPVAKNTDAQRDELHRVAD
ncbi:hypothetical protein HUS96_27950, partial [Pseudomonas protegens]|nr:hypothetical protein [Pseudomonas protegens]